MENINPIIREDKKDRAEDWNTFSLLESEVQVALGWMIDNGFAYFRDERDSEGKIKTISVFESSTGKLLYFQDMRKISEIYKNTKKS